MKRPFQAGDAFKQNMLPVELQKFKGVPLAKLEFILKIEFVHPYSTSPNSMPSLMESLSQVFQIRLKNHDHGYCLFSNNTFIATSNDYIGFLHCFQKYQQEFKFYFGLEYDHNNV